MANQAIEKVLEVDGEVITPLSLSVEDVRSLYPSHTVQTSFLNGSHSMTLSFTGARLWDVINSAQPNLNPKSTLRIVARANDGFKCVIRWHEIEPTLTHRIVLVAYAQDKEPLGAGGPLRLVVPGDERGRRHLRGLAHLTVIAQTGKETIADEEDK